MHTLRFSKVIPASPEKIWTVMFGKDTYPQWTEVFHAGSDVQGEWKQGEQVWFTAPNAHGTLDGMCSQVEDLRTNEYMTLHHLGIVQDGKVVVDTSDAEEWKDKYERYRFTTVTDGTLVEVELDMEESYESYFNEVWPKALERVQQIVLEGQSSSVTVYAWIKAPIETVWECYTGATHMTKWNFAAEDWECPTASVDLRVGGSFSARMQAKDGSFGFDFGADYTKVQAPTALSYRMSDGRTVDIELNALNEYVFITVRFDIEHQNPRDMQRQGWQMILNNFKKYVETQTK